MRMTFAELMDKLGVPPLHPYETCPYTIYDSEKGLTCSAEARMGSDPHEVECEVQMMYDTPPASTPPMQQIIWFRIKPQMNEDWATREARLKGEPMDLDIYNWEEKCCTFFAELTRFLKLGDVPDIDDLINEVFHTRDRFHDQYGGGGGKAPKIKPGQLLGMKKGQGF